MTSRRFLFFAFDAHVFPVCLLAHQSYRQSPVPKNDVQPCPLKYISDSIQKTKSIQLQGIPLGAVVASTLAERHKRDVGFAFDRKEAKDHGEKGKLVGENLEVIGPCIKRFSLLCDCQNVAVRILWYVVGQCPRAKWTRGLRADARRQALEGLVALGVKYMSPLVLLVLVCVR